MPSEEKIRAFTIDRTKLEPVRKGIKGMTIVLGSNIQLNYYEVEPGEIGRAHV